MTKPGWRRPVLALAVAAGVVAAIVVVDAAPAQAAVPDKVGFVLWNGAVVGTGTTPAGTSVINFGIGRYQVKFPGAGATGGVVHTTAINSVPHWCQAESWSQSGPDELVNIRCYRAGATLNNTAFSAIFYSSSGISPFGQYGYVDAMALGGTFSQYNSVGAANTVTHLGAGKWTVTFNSIGSPGPRDGSLQATPVNTAVAAHCSVGAWSSNPAVQSVTVYCFDAVTLAPLDTRFTLTYQYPVSLYGAISPPLYWGYLWWMPGVGPATTNNNSIVGPGGNNPAAAGVGLTTIKFPRIGVAPPDDVQVTAFTTAPNWCSLDAIWTHPGGGDLLVQHVSCFGPAGGALNVGFLASANSIN
jgi:hypothetical protein